jgi:hypothetical protein
MRLTDVWTTCRLASACTAREGTALFIYELVATLRAQAINHYIPRGSRWYVSVSDYELPGTLRDKAEAMFSMP